MSKARINITLDQDLIDFAKNYAKFQRTSVSEIITQFILNLKRLQNSDPTETIMSDPDFRESLMETVSDIRSGKVEWHSYDEVFGADTV